MTGEERDDMPSILDGRLVRLLDGEAGPEERREIEELLERSPDVRERYEQLRAIAVDLSEGLAGEGLPPTPALDLLERAASGRRTGMRGVSRRWRAAAVVALLVGVGVTVQPVRAFLATGATRLLDLLTSQEPAPVEAPPATPVADRPSTVRFAPEGAVFVVTLEHAQTAGSLQITAADAAAEITASVLDGSGESLVVLPSELRISNGPGSVADYRLEVPRTLERVDVRVEGTSLTSIRPGEAPGTWMLPLGDGAR